MENIPRHITPTEKKKNPAKLAPHFFQDVLVLKPLASPFWRSEVNGLPTGNVFLKDEDLGTRIEKGILPHPRAFTKTYELYMDIHGV